MRTWVLASMLAVSAPALAAGPEEHVSFLVMGKTANTRQSAEGIGRLLNYHFFAEIFVKEGGRVTDASLSFPGGGRETFEDLGYVLEVHGGRYDNERALDDAYPNGAYEVRFDTPDGGVDGRTLRVHGTGEGVSRIPPAVHIRLHQEGEEVSPSAVNPERDLTVTWSSFATARADENGILDDLIFVVIGNCHGEKIVHSGRPFEGTDYLSYTAKSYVVPHEKLSPGEPHQLYVEQAKVDTSKEDGIVGLVTYAATTFLDFETTGVASGEPCPASMPKMDGGQTDRK